MRTRADRQLLNACKLWVRQRADFLVTAIGAVRVHPADEREQVRGLQFHVVVLAAETQVNQRTRVGEVLHRAQGGVAGGIALLEVFAHQRPGKTGRVRLVVQPETDRPDEREIRLLEHTVAATQREIGLRLALAITGVTLAAVTIQHGLHEPLVTHAGRAPGRRRQFARPVSQRQAGCVHRRGRVLLVTADATPAFARQQSGRGTHRVQRALVFVEQLEVKHHTRRRFEINGAVGLDRHGAEDAFDAVVLQRRHSGAGEPGVAAPERIGLVVHLKHAEELHFFGREIGHALGHVRAVENAWLGCAPILARARPDDEIAVRGRRDARFHRHRVPDVMRALINQFAIAMHVHEVETELPVAAGGHEEVFLRERIGRLVGVELSGGVIVRGFDGILRRRATFGPSHVGGDFGQPVREVAAFARIKNSNRAGEPVVMRDAREHHAIAARNGPRFGKVIRPDTLVAPERLHAGAVLPRSPEALNAPQGLVYVIPPRENHPAVVEQRGQPLRLALGAEEVKVAPVGVAPCKNVGVGVRHAPDERVAARAAEHDAAIRQVDRIEIVVRAVGDLAQAAAIEADFVKVKSGFVVPLHAEEHAPRVEGKVRSPETRGLIGRSPRGIKPTAAPGLSRRSIPRGKLADLAARMQTVEHEQPATWHRHHAVAVTHLMLPLAARWVGIVHQQNLCEVRHRILELDTPLHGADGQVEFAGGIFFSG